MFVYFSGSLSVTFLICHLFAPMDSLPLIEDNLKDKHMYSDFKDNYLHSCIKYFYIPLVE